MIEAEKALLINKVVELGDLVVLTMGEPIGQSGGTNTMKILRIGEHRSA
jgi:pyruvate kinase